MKKKHRNITVDGVQYAWTQYGSGKEHDITVWKDKKPIFTEAGVREGNITPSIIRGLIEDHLKLKEE